MFPVAAHDDLFQHVVRTAISVMFFVRWPGYVMVCRDDVKESPLYLFLPQLYIYILQSFITGFKALHLFFKHLIRSKVPVNGTLSNDRQRRIRVQDPVLSHPFCAMWRVTLP